MPKDVPSPVVQDVPSPIPTELPISLLQDVPSEIFFEQITNPTVRSVLTGAEKLPDSISPSSLLLCITDALYKAQDIFNLENSSDIGNIATVSAREVGPLVEKDRRLPAQVFYTVGGNLVFEGNAGAIIL
jgi:hypothetical protein